MYPSLVESTTEPELTETNPNPNGVGVKVGFDESDEKQQDEVGEQDDEPQGERMGLGYKVLGLELCKRVGKLICVHMCILEKRGRCMYTCVPEYERVLLRGSFLSGNKVTVV